MANLFRLTWVDFRYLLKAKELWIALAVIILYTGSIYMYTRNGTAQHTVDFYYQLINDLSFYVFILVPAISLAKDYTFKTTRLLYTGPYSKYEVVSSKFLSVLVFYVMASVLHRLGANGLMLYHERTFSFKLLLQDVPQTMLVYVIVGLFTCTFAFLITLLTYSRMATIITLVAVFNIEKFLRGILLLLFQQESVKLILTHNPIVIVSEALQYSTITFMDSLILVAVTLFLAVGTIIVLHKKEIQ